MQKTHYVTNRALLAEIFECKRSYCYYVDDEFARYDAIVSNVGKNGLPQHDNLLDLITPEVIEETRKKRAAEMMAAERSRQKEAGVKPYAINVEPVDPASIPVEDLVFRVMTFEHIPIDPERKRRTRNGDQNFARTNFPPFKHVIIKDGEVKEVGRSHWIGGFENGLFSVDHGRISNKFATMLMTIVERYSRRPNWRSYCVDTATEALTQRGWLRHDEITTDDMILSYEAGKLKWSRIKSIYRGDHDGKMFKLTVTGLDALVTPGHKFITQSGLKEVEYLVEKDRLILGGDAVDGPDTPVYSDAFVELVGWVVTEGNIYYDKARRYPRVSISQNDNPKAERIRECVRRLGGTLGESRSRPVVYFTLAKELCLRVTEVIDVEEKVLTMPFILSLTAQQRELLINTMVDGDGYRIGSLRRYYQKSKKHVDAFVALCTLAGLRTSVKLNDCVSFGKPTQVHHVVIFSDRAKHSNVENIDFHGAKRNTRGHKKTKNPNVPTVQYKGTVWCPATEYGSFMARRNGYVYLTGNSYVDEMRAFALMQLSTVSLQFDEMKSENPFAFYTTVIKNSFTRVLNLERRSQDIRDDLLIINGAAPSYTRQIDNELEFKFEEQGEQKKERRGAKAKTGYARVSSNPGKF